MHHLPQNPEKQFYDMKNDYSTSVAAKIRYGDASAASLLRAYAGSALGGE
jgi:hypothetical protein